MMMISEILCCLFMFFFGSFFILASSCLHVIFFCSSSLFHHSFHYASNICYNIGHMILLCDLCTVLIWQSEMIQHQFSPLITTVKFIFVVVAFKCNVYKGNRHRCSMFVLVILDTSYEAFVISFLDTVYSLQWKPTLV